MLIPMMSLLYNTEDRKLYPVKEHTFVNPETGNVQDVPPAEWVPAEAPISDDTFHLVAKTYMVAFPTLDPNRYENALFFPTQETTDKILAFLKKTVPNTGEYTLEVQGDPKMPRDYQDRVYIKVTRWAGEENAKHGKYAPGYVALGISQGGEESMKDRILAEMANDGLIQLESQKRDPRGRGPEMSQSRVQSKRGYMRRLWYYLLTRRTRASSPTPAATQRRVSFSSFRPISGSPMLSQTVCVPSGSPPSGSLCPDGLEEGLGWG